MKLRQPAVDFHGLLTAAELGECLGRSRPELDRLVAAGKLPPSVWLLTRERWRGNEVAEALRSWPLE